MLPPIEIPMTEKTTVLNTMRDALISHDTRLQDIRNDLTDTQKDVDVLQENVILGTPSGQLSHAERIRNLETYVESTKDTFKYWGRLIGGALLLNFVGFMAGIIVAIIKFLPILQRLAEKP